MSNLCPVITWTIYPIVNISKASPQFHEFLLTNHLFTNTTLCIVLSCKSRVDHTHVYYFVLRTNNVLQTFGPLAERSNVPQKDFYLCFIDDAKAFDQVEQDEIKQKC